MVKKKYNEQNDIDKLNTVWVSIPSLRLELAKLSKEGYEQYPLGEMLAIIRTIVRSK